ncbi:GGDEF domain-containing protein [Sphingorhabdus sp. 109]|jgi:diguanylate cyclase (GGDEF)-like protein|uniref:GGDEF domain-containing protein n=1 Tax=Sphingorhabdus sp. 109 TaxID=2653173 RepID=UPI0012F3C32F|nr:GGDEF domain-containing protein [Sphingorhabdus sp. 109]VWX56830.1 putative diguanylate cyclase YcdT [Sphingorhabdus sp. 109]
MSENSGFHIQTVLILAIFALVFGLIHFFNKRQPFPGWVALAYSAALGAYIIDSTRHESTHVGFIFASTGLFWMFSLAIIKAIYVRCNAAFPSVLVGLILSSAITAFVVLTFVAPDISIRSVLVSVVAAILLALALPPLWKAGEKVIDGVLFGVIATVALIFVARIVVVYYLHGLSLTEQSYSQSEYAWIFHFTSGICALALAVVLLYAAGLDMVWHFHGQSNRDPLTGLLNRRGLKALFNASADQHPNGDLTRAVILFDIDHFKRVNDEYGHAAGDKVLQRVAKTASGLCQEQAEVARTGGEEFAILTGWIPFDSAQQLAQHICDSLRFVAHPELAADHKVTASFGLVALANGDSLNDAMDRADQALYQAKRNGRNQVALAQAA